MDGIKKNLLDIIFPRRCLGCDILLGNETDSYICRLCLKAVPFTKGFACAFCGSPVVGGKTCVFCSKNHFLDRLLAVTSYDNPLVEKILKTTKYRFVKTLGYDIASMMVKYFQKLQPKLDIDSSTVVVPVPLHRRRLNWRGFNQAEIIAGEIAESFGWPLAPGLLKRARNQRPQAEMPDKLSRIENMRGVFECRDQTSNYRSPASTTGRTILLIDDVSTTGATLDDCARALKNAGPSAGQAGLPTGQAGAKEVIGFVFARG